MTVPNAGPLHPEPSEPDGTEIKRGNPALVYRDEPPTGGRQAASVRATAVSHRFGGVRHPLTRSDGRVPDEPPASDGGDPDASQ